jgi:hypothetical protein
MYSHTSEHYPATAIKNPKATPPATIVTRQAAAEPPPGDDFILRGRYFSRLRDKTFALVDSGAVFLADILAEQDIPRVFSTPDAAMEYADRFRDVVETHRLDAASREAWYAKKQNIIDLTPNDDVRAARANKRRCLHFDNDGGSHEAPAVPFPEDTLDSDDDVAANQTKTFYEQTARHIKGHIDDGTTHELLRDTVISKGAGVAFAYQLRAVHKKAAVVFAYCNMMAMIFLGTFLLPIVGPPTTYVRYAVSVSLGVSVATVMRYLAEYTYYDAEAHELPIEVGKNGVERAASVTPGGKGGFHMDRRGTYEHRPNWLLHETDLKNKVLRSMKRMGDKLTVDSFTVLINDVLRTLPTTTLEEHRIELPLNRSTAYRWMLALGARRVTYVKSYYMRHLTLWRIARHTSTSLAPTLSLGYRIGLL